MTYRILNGVLLLAGLLTCVFLFAAYSSLLSFFPWGNDHAYVIWGLVLYYLIPGFIFGGVVQIVIWKNDGSRRNVLLLVGLTALLPPMIGFELETDLLGRWIGVITSLFSAIWIGINLISVIKGIIADFR